MVRVLVFVPSPPLLLDALGGAITALRSVCQQAISALDGGDVLVVGASPTQGRVTGTVDATPYGAPGRPADRPLPLALAVGRTLLPAASLYGVTATSQLPEVEGLLVVGDGTARRTEKAPGHLDERAAGFDAVVENALAAGDPEALLALEPTLAETLLVGGLDAWRAAARAALAEVRPGGAAPRGWTGAVHLAEAPYGVGYFVATWIPT